MAEISGVVQEIKTTARGGKTVYDVIVGGQAYGAGFYAPKCATGDYVKFDLDTSRGYQNIARNSLKVSKNKAPAEAVAVAEATMPSKSSTGASVDHKQEVISRQSALNSALAFMAVLAQADALGLPAASAKGKRIEVLEAMLAKYKQEFYESSTGVKYKEISPSAKAVVDESAAEYEEVAAPEDSEWE